MSNTWLVRYSQQGDNAQREALRPDHIAYRKGLGAALVLAGPLLGEGGDPLGSVVIVMATDAAAADAIARHDPYVKAGLLQVESIERMRIAALQPPQG